MIHLFCTASPQRKKRKKISRSYDIKRKGESASNKKEEKEKFTPLSSFSFLFDIKMMNSSSFSHGMLKNCLLCSRTPLFSLVRSGRTGGRREGFPVLVSQHEYSKCWDIEHRKVLPVVFDNRILRSQKGEAVLQLSTITL